MVGPWYTQTDNLQPMGESIIRNLEIGGKIAKDMGHRMNVGYLPDSFGHNPQTPQIMRQVGIDNFTFYRGLDPKKVNNKLYFDYVAPSGDKVLGVWQTHYFTSSKWDTYEGFMKTGYKDQGTTGEVTVESYNKRSLGAPFWITMGGDMRNFKPGINDYVKKLNLNDKKYNFIMSDYETAIKEVKHHIKENKITLDEYKGELRDSFTGRAHRSIMSARMDLKQKIFKLESSLIEVIEPLSIVADKNGIDVPWKMIERSWKDLFKTSAHDSYGGCVEDFVYKKMMQRLEDALLITRGIETILMKLISFSKRSSNTKDQLFIMNLSPKKYTGPYKVQMSFEPEEEGTKYSNYSFQYNNKEIEHYVQNRNNEENYNRTLDDVVLYVENMPSFEIMAIDIKYNNKKTEINKSSNIENKFWNVSIQNNTINFKNLSNKKEYKDVVKFIADPSAGDTYDHSPISFEENEIFISEITSSNSIIKNNLSILEIEFEGKLPNDLKEWEIKKVSKLQKIKLSIILFNEQLHLKINVKNNCNNLRMRVLISLNEKVKTWEHDMQFFMIERKVEEDKTIDWETPDKNNDKWLEYPTNLSPHQKIIRSQDAKIALITNGSREHEVINREDKSFISLTLYRALDMFSRGDMAYRPGRPSGRPSIAPLAQLKDTTLEYDLLFIDNNISNENLFNKSNIYSEKPFYAKNAWDTKNPLEAFNFEEEFYLNSKVATNIKYKLPFELPKELIITSLYNNVNNKHVARILNVSNKKITFDGEEMVPWKLKIKEV